MNANVILRRGVPTRVILSDQEAQEFLFYHGDCEAVGVPVGSDLGPQKSGYRAWWGMIYRDGSHGFGEIPSPDLSEFFREDWEEVPTGWYTRITEKTQEQAITEFGRRCWCFQKS